MGDYCTVDRLRSYAGIEAVVDDTLLERAIEGAESFINQETRREFFIASDSWRSYHAVDAVDGDTLFLDHDLAAVSTILNGNGEEIEVGDYALLPSNATPSYGIQLKWDVWTYSSSPIEAIRIKGYWGYSKTAPADIVQATTHLAAYLYKQKDSQVFETAGFVDGGVLVIPKGVPVGVLLTIGNYRRQGLA